MTTLHNWKIPTVVRDHPPLADAVAEVDRLSQRHDQERAKLQQLAGALRDAPHQDQRALVDAVRAGKPEPRKSATEQAQAAHAKQAALTAAIDEAAQDARRDLGQLIAEHADTLAKLAVHQAADADARLHQAVEALAAAHQDRTDADTLAAYIEQTRTAGWSPWSPGSHVRPIVLPGGTTVQVSDLFTALRQDAARTPETSAPAEPIAGAPGAVIASELEESVEGFGDRTWT